MASTSADPPTNRRVVPVDEVTQRLLAAPPSRLPKSLIRIRAALRNKFQKDTVDPTLKSLLDSAAAQLYYNCANNYDYDKLCDAFGLPDYMSSWYKLTLMHCWMILMRMHSSLDAQAYLRLQRSMLSTLWFDIDARLKIVGEELKQSLSSQTDLKHMHGLHLQTFLEYDEGFLSNDPMFAAAIWRCLYVGRRCDPIHVLRVIAYIRSTIAWLDTLDMNDIMVDGIKEWKQLKPRDAVLDSRPEESIEESEGLRKAKAQST